MKYVLAMLLAIGLACGKDVAAPVGSAGSYALRTIGNQSVPWTYADSSKVYSGVIELNTDSTFLDILKYDSNYAGLRSVFTDTIVGRYKITGASIEFRTEEGYQIGGYNGTEITLTLGEQAWRYAR